VLLVLTACSPRGASPSGQSGSITKEQFVARANQVCAGGNARTRALPSPGLTIADQLAYLDHVISDLASVYSQLRALPEPRGDQQTIQTIFEKADTALNLARQESAALSAGTTTQAADIERQLTAASADVGSAFRAYGLTTCGQS
jgi:hypothetical protein